MPTIDSLNIVAANLTATSTSVGGNILGRATETTARLLATTLQPTAGLSSAGSHASYSTSISPFHADQVAAMAAHTTESPSLDGIASSPLPPISQYSFEELGHWPATSNWTGLVHALLASFSVILVSELGDKTFIITAIMAMKNSRSLVFISSATALLLMTVLSVGMGVAVTVIPEVYTHYASIVLFLCFGLKMLKESYDMSTDGSEQGESEFDEVKRSLETTDGGETAKQSRRDDNNNHNNNDQLDSPGTSEGPKLEEAKQETWWNRTIQTLYVAPIVIKVFTMVFVAEWGDRSQISTVILAAREDVVGVFIGSLSGHVFCTGLAVIGGRFVADMISVRTMTLLGAITFLLFAVFAILMGPEQN